MLTKVFSANTIDKAVEQILDELKEDAAGTASSGGGGRHNVIYFDGWDGLGASAVLGAVGRHLTREAGRRAPAATGLEFSWIFYIDCSKWESRRAMQRMIAEQLELPASVMEMFQAQDEEDDYQGVGKGSRAGIPQVAKVINQRIQKLDRFLLIFHNGSSEEIDLDNLGFPVLDQYSTSKVLWSFQGRFRAYPRTKVDGALKNTWRTDVFLSADSSKIGEQELCDILRHEAEEVAQEMMNAGSSIDWHAAATNFYLYVLKICRMSNDLATDYDLATHICNYWKCDAIMDLQREDVSTDDGVDKLWQSYDALQHEMRLDVCYYQNPYFLSPVEGRLLKRMAYWSSPTYGLMLMPDGHIPRGMFQQFNKLCVLKLSAVEFSFRSPPFLCCHNLRYLWIDRCRDSTWAPEVAKEEDIAQFLQRLWVLDVRYSNRAFLSKAMMDLMTQLRELNVTGEDEWLDTDLLQGRMHKICRLRIKDSSSRDTSMTQQEKILFSGMAKMELLEFSRSHGYWLFSVESSCSSLETVVISGPTDLQYIYLTGCAKLKNIFLSGSFPELYFIQITGAAVETLDLSAVMVPKLNVLHLFACGKLCSILWPSAAEGKRKRYLDVLRINTTQKEGQVENFYWRISVKDARILGSLEPVKDYFGSNVAHVDISSPIRRLYGDAIGSKDNQIMSSYKQLKDNAVYADVILTSKASDDEGGGSSDPPATMCICPPPPDVSFEGCYLRIEDHLRTKSQAAEGIITLPGFICNGAKVLHVHDSLHVASILESPTASVTWNELEWCRVEACPNIECVFSPQFSRGRPDRSDSNTSSMFKKLRTAWVSDLPNARYIWNWIGSSGDWYHGETFANLTLLHLDSCPNLIQIIHLPLVHMAFERLERLEIMWCGDLIVAFHFFGKAFFGWIFSNLKHVHLHELPKLHNICNIWIKVSMPKLETIKIRGCWSLRILPFVTSDNVVECDCEKEWWDGLEWKSAEHARHYKPIHPRYYKKTMLRGSILR